ncbi:superoxide dismutase family protein [uncultured Maribacter sp.]|uniref:superoxide dismutase family protein n=1 Tax=uncultured Maribacter sp. TaxID=431308 RepID=UPI0030DDA776|tara:strand:- start:732 stop:1319 length:588 start_codon:yes stop_codon:yes gene_type:complete
MKNIKILVLVLTVAGFYNCKDAKKEADNVNIEMDSEMEKVAEEVTTNRISMLMEPKSDSEVSGEVSFVENDGKVTMTATFTGLTEGEHAIHIHQTADCSAVDGSSTGGHWNPTNEPHGKWGDAKGYHKGDIGNFTAESNGEGMVEFSTDQWCIGCDDENKNIVGKGLIVHQGTDDLTSQPSGAAGARISCAGLIQ